jgi:hypothetical protein
VKNFSFFLLLGTMLTGVTQAATLTLSDKDNTVSLSIYKNLALVKDMRTSNLRTGINDVIFDGVAQQIQPETAIIYGKSITLLEQAYDYDLMTYNNLIDKSVGQEVTTVRENPQTGENIFAKATLIGSLYGKPILRFSYGIDANFPGRIIFNEIPAGISNKPTLTAKLNSTKDGEQKLYLAYLSEGLSWKTDYIANVTDNKTLDLTGWVTITNESGVDYKNAKIQLIAGDVNVPKPNRPLAVRSMDSVRTMSAAALAPLSYIEEINNYELYTLPNTTTIKDKQNKQIGLIAKQNVSYDKEFTLSSQLLLNDSSEFNNIHPTISYVMQNTAAANLGISLPEGTMRFYENDKNGNLQFIGAGRINDTAKNDTFKVSLGKALNISAKGKLQKTAEKELSRTKRGGCVDATFLQTYQAEVIFNNGENSEATVIFEQPFTGNFKITAENIGSKAKNAQTREWHIKIPAESKKTLTFSVEQNTLKNCFIHQ